MRPRILVIEFEEVNFLLANEILYLFYTLHPRLRPVQRRDQRPPHHPVRMDYWRWKINDDTTWGGEINRHAAVMFSQAVSQGVTKALNDSM